MSFSTSSQNGTENNCSHAASYREAGSSVVAEMVPGLFSVAKRLIG